MRKKLISVIGAFAALAAAGTVLAAPAHADKDLPVRAGYDSCGNFQIWVNGNPTIHYLICNPPA